MLQVDRNLWWSGLPTNPYLGCCPNLPVNNRSHHFGTYGKTEIWLNGSPRHTSTCDVKGIYSQNCEGKQTNFTSLLIRKKLTTTAFRMYCFRSRLPGLIRSLPFMSTKSQGRCKNACYSWEKPYLIIFWVWPSTLLWATSCWASSITSTMSFFLSILNFPLNAALACKSEVYRYSSCYWTEMCFLPSIPTLLIIIRTTPSWGCAVFIYQGK